MIARFKPITAQLVRGGALAVLAAMPFVVQQHALAQSGVSTTPDLNGDGIEDYFLRLPVWSTTTEVLGQLRVFSGADNTLIRSFLSLQVDDGFALSSASAGDQDGDGTDDLVIGAPLAVVDGIHRGKVYLVSGATGEILHTVTAPPNGFGGMTVAGLDDLDGDGLREIAYSVRLPTGAYEDSAFVVAHSPATGADLFSLAGAPGDTDFGYAIAFLGDTNNDGSPEIAVSAPTHGGTANARGVVFVFECFGPNGEPRPSQTLSDARLAIHNTNLPLSVFGGALYLGPDIDGDGDRELIVGSSIIAQPAEIAVVEAYDLASGAVVASLSISAEKLRSDINGDLMVDNRDIAEALDRMDEPVDSFTPKSGDIDGDGLVDAGDVSSVIDHIDQTALTPGTFSNGQKGEVTEAISSLLFGISPCHGVGGGGWGGVVVPPNGPDDGGLLPVVPVVPEDPACCLYRLSWLGYPEGERPPPPPGCDIGGNGGGGGDDDDSPPDSPPGWSDDPDNGDPPPECDGMSIVGPSFIEKGRSSTFVVYGAPEGTLLWDVSPYPGPLRPLTVPTLPNYSVQGHTLGLARVIARVYEGSHPICGAEWDVAVVDCEQIVLDGPGSVAVGAEAVYTAQNVGGGITIEWEISGDLDFVTSTSTSVTVRGISSGSGRVRAVPLYSNEPLTCELEQDVAVTCDFGISGPHTLLDGQAATYHAQEHYAGQQVRWFASGPIQIVGSNEGWTVQVLASGCGNATLTARLNDADGLPTGCVVNTPITVQGPDVAPLTLSGIPSEGYMQLAPSEEERIVTLVAEGVGEFSWTVTSSVEGAVIVEPAGPVCTLRIAEPTVVEVRLTREFCDQEQTVEASFAAVILDLAIDSDNDGDITGADDMIEADGAGHIILSNTLDADADGIPDHADGIGLLPGYPSAETLDDGEFSPVVVTLSNLEGLPFNALDLTYNASDPAGIHVSDTEFFARPDGLMRLWRVPAHVARNPLPVSQGGDYIPPGIYTLDALGLSAQGGEVTLHLEAIRPTVEPGGGEIQIELVAVGANAGADGPAGGPSDLILCTSTEIEILGRGKRDTEWLPIDAFTSTELPPDDFPGGILPDGLQWGAWQAYVIFVHDPRPGFTAIHVGGQELPLLTLGDGRYVTPTFLCLDPEELPEGTPAGEVPATFPAGYSVIWLTPGASMEIRYNPNGTIIRSKGLLAVTEETAELVKLINEDIVPGMEAADWIPANPNNPGAFGNEVHARVTSRINGHNPRFLADVMLNTETMQIQTVGAGGSGGGVFAQIDVIAFEPGYSAGVGDILDVNRVKFAFEIKTGIGGTVHPSQRSTYVRIFGAAKFRSVNSMRRWTLGGGWNDTPRVTRLARAYSVMNSSATKKVRNAASVAGAAIPIIALVDLGDATMKAEELATICEELALVHPDEYDYGPLVHDASIKMGQIASALGVDEGPSLAFSYATFVTVYGGVE